MASAILTLMMWKLTFDNGTLVLTGPEKSLPECWQDQFVWDERVRGWRAQGSSYGSIREFARQHGFEWENGVFLHETGCHEWTSCSLRPYQEAALTNWDVAGRRGIICLPTGAGKTRTAIAAMKLADHSALCLVPTRVLLDQWVEAIREFYSGPVGFLGDGKRDIQPITVSTFESAYRNMRWLGNRFGSLIVDEVHHFGRGQKDEALLMSAAPFRLGLTATPPAEDGHLAALTELMGEVVFSLDVANLTGSYLADFNLVKLPLRLTPVEKVRYEREYGTFLKFFRSYMGRNPGATWADFTRMASQSSQGKRALSAFFRAKRIVSFTGGKRRALARILERHREQRMLVFTADTATAYEISREFLIMPITADIKRKERDQALCDLKEGRLKALVSCRVLNEGVDVPDADVAVVLGGTSSGREHVQRIGRLLRPKDGKHALIYELTAAGTFEERHSQKRGKALATKGRTTASYDRRPGDTQISN